MRERTQEAAGIWMIHGPLDAITTILATREVGIHREANPIIRDLLAVGDLPAAAIMCACVAVAAAAWPIAAEALDAPPVAAIAVAAPGVAAVLVNLWVFL